MKQTNDATETTQKTYPVEILASFELQLVHQFSDITTQSSAELITDVFDDLILEVEDVFSSMSIGVSYEGAKRIRKDGLYRFIGNIKRCYEFSVQDVDLLAGELIDGTFDSQLNDMRLAVEIVCEQSGYELTVDNFNWADDEIVNEE